MAVLSQLSRRFASRDDAVSSQLLARFWRFGNPLMRAIWRKRREINDLAAAIPHGVPASEPTVAQPQPLRGGDPNRPNIPQPQPHRRGPGGHTQD